MNVRIGALLTAVLVLSIAANVKLFLDEKHRTRVVTFGDANTRETYETVHHVKDAQHLATGKGIRVGILGRYFGTRRHPGFYAGGRDFVDDMEALETIDEHGYWMATTLKEIAPGVDVFALNCRTGNKDREARGIVDAIDWAIDNDLDILTYSAEAFRPELVGRIDSAVRNAVDHGILATFIHYPLPENLLPWGLLPDEREGGRSRAPDVRILHYDYNGFLLPVYDRYVAADRRPRSGNDVPYFSISSTSQVAAGVVAMMMEVRRDLPPEEYKRILISTGTELEYKGRRFDRVVDAGKAVAFMQAGMPP